MIPRRIRLKGFLSYRDEQEIQLDGASLWMLSGTNGSGKSSIFDAITYALFGHHRGGASQAGELMNKDSNQLAVEFEFTIDQQAYLIRRTLRRTPKGVYTATQQIFRYETNLMNESDWAAIPDTSRKIEFDKWITEKIGLNFETFTSSVLLLQGRAEKLLDAAPKGRFELLAGIVDLERYRRLHDRSNEKKLELKNKIEALTSRLNAIPEVTEMELWSVSNQVTEIQELKQKNQNEIDHHLEIMKQAERWAELNDRRNQLVQQIKKIEYLFENRSEIEKQYHRYEELGQVLPALQRIVTERQEVESLRAQQNQIQNERTKSQEQQTQLGNKLNQSKKQRLIHLNRTEEIDKELHQLRSDAIKFAGLVPKAKQLQETESEAALVKQQLLELPHDADQQLTRLRHEFDAVLETERTLPILKTLNRKLIDYRESKQKIIELQQRLHAREEEGKSLSREQEATKKIVESIQVKVQSIQADAIRYQTLLEESRRQFQMLSQLDGESRCQYCGQPLTLDHLKQETIDRKKQLATSELNHQQTNALLTQTQQEQSDALTKLNDLDKRLRVLREEYKETKVELASIEKALLELRRDCQSTYDQLPERFRRNFSSEINPDWDTIRPMPREKLEEIEQKLPLGDTFREQLKKLEKQVKQYETLQLRDDELQKRIITIRRELGSETIESILSRDSTIRSESKVREDQLKVEKLNLKKIDAELESLHLQFEQASIRVNQLERTIDSLMIRETTCNSTIDQLEKSLSTQWRVTAKQIDVHSLQGMKDERAELESKQIQEAFNRLRSGEGNLQLLRSQIEEIDRLIQSIPVEAQTPLAELRTRFQSLKDQIHAIEAAYQAKSQEENLLRSHLQQRQELHQDKLNLERDHNSFSLLTQLLGREKLQRHLVREAEKQIVEYANSVLDRLSGGELSLRLTQNHDSDDSTKALDLEAFNRLTGSEQPINVSFLSGSQRFRVAVSLALGIGQYASRQHRPIESVIIDEGFGCLDRQGRQVMIQELQNLRGQLRCILLVSHQEEFADAFADGYRFELLEGRTQVTRMRR